MKRHKMSFEKRPRPQKRTICRGIKLSPPCFVTVEVIERDLGSQSAMYILQGCKRLGEYMEWSKLRLKQTCELTAKSQSATTPTMSILCIDSMYRFLCRIWVVRYADFYRSTSLTHYQMDHEGNNPGMSRKRKTLSEMESKNEIMGAS